MDAATFAITYGVVLETALSYLQKFVKSRFDYKIEGEILGLLSLILGFVMGSVYSFYIGTGFKTAIAFGLGVAASSTITHIAKTFANVGIIPTTVITTPVDSTVVDTTSAPQV